MANSKNINMLYSELRRNTLEMTELLIAYHKRMEMAERKIIVLAGIVGALDKSNITSEQWTTICSIVGVGYEDLFKLLSDVPDKIVIELSNDVGSGFFATKDHVTNVNNRINTALDKLEDHEQVLFKLQQTSDTTLLKRIIKLEQELNTLRNSFNKSVPAPGIKNKQVIKKVIKRVDDKS
jgi:hypothetical protein